MSREAASALRIDSLVVRYGGVTAVCGCSLAVESSAITALVGPSGCGKTSLLRAVAGFERPASGSVEIAGRIVASADSWVPPERRSVGMVFQEGALFPHLTVGDNVAFGARGFADGPQRCESALELVGLTRLAHRYPDEISGGQQQRVALARALAPSPKIVLLDEPFASLDATLRQRVREQVRGILRAAGTTAVLVTHDQEEALSFADRVAVMIDGEVRQTGTAREIYESPSSVDVASFIGDGQLVACRLLGARLVSPLGEAACEAGPGNGLLLVRPEDLVVLPRTASMGVPGTIESRQFFGHDQLHDVRLDTGEQVRVRSAAAAPESEQRVRLALRRKRYRLFLEGGPGIAAATPFAIAPDGVED